MVGAVLVDTKKNWKYKCKKVCLDFSRDDQSVEKYIVKKFTSALPDVALLVGASVLQV